jgi:hypothetical protein
MSKGGRGRVDVGGWKEIVVEVGEVAEEEEAIVAEIWEVAIWETKVRQGAVS